MQQIHPSESPQILNAMTERKEMKKNAYTIVDACIKIACVSKHCSLKNKFLHVLIIYIHGLGFDLNL